MNCLLNALAMSFGLMNCLLNALAMSFGLMCVLSLKVIELLSCCGGRLCASPCMVFQ